MALVIILSAGLTPVDLLLDVVGMLGFALALAGMVMMIVKKYSFSSTFFTNFSLGVIAVGTILVCNGGMMALGTPSANLGMTVLVLGSGIVGIIGGIVMVFR